MSMDETPPLPEDDMRRRCSVLMEQHSLRRTHTKSLRIHGDKLFEKYDTNNDGYIDELELNCLLSDLGIPPGQRSRYRHDAIMQCDLDHDGKIDKAEFQIWCSLNPGEYLTLQSRFDNFKRASLDAFLESHAGHSPRCPGQDQTTAAIDPRLLPRRCLLPRGITQEIDAKVENMLERNPSMDATETRRKTRVMLRRKTLTGLAADYARYRTRASQHEQDEFTFHIQAAQETAHQFSARMSKVYKENLASCLRIVGKLKAGKGSRHSEKRAILRLIKARYEKYHESADEDGENDITHFKIYLKRATQAMLDHKDQEFEEHREHLDDILDVWEEYADAGL